MKTLQIWMRDPKAQVGPERKLIGNNFDMLIERMVKQADQYAYEYTERQRQDIRKWVEYNKHNMGELGEFVRIQYVYNKLEELSSHKEERKD